MTDKKIYSLSKIAIAIDNLISKTCTQNYWVKAEIVKLNYYEKSGHCYPDLVEKKGDRIIAEMRGNIWKGNFDKIDKKFRDTLNEKLGDDMTVVFLASIKFHPVYGLSLNIVDIDPEFTLGDLAKQKAETIKKLREKNIFNKNRTTTLPIVPKTIAVISVSTSKGYNDFVNVITNNSWSYKYHHALFPAVLQGDNAILSIIKQLKRIERFQDVFDAVAIIRGGGGEIGLSCYNDYRLSESVANFPLPVLSGIGHSSNETVTEMVSHKSFITPTKIAEYLIQMYHNFSVPIQEHQQKIIDQSKYLFERQKSNISQSARLFDSLVQKTFNLQKQTLEQNRKSLIRTGRHIIQNETNGLKDKVNKVQVLSSRLIEQQHNDLNAKFVIVKNSSEKVLTRETKELAAMQQSILVNNKYLLKNANRDLDFVTNKLQLLSPKNVLKRGYSITRLNGNSVKDAKKLRRGDIIETEFLEGKIDSRIENIKNKKRLPKWLKK